MTRSNPLTPDCLIVGGGPAGAELPRTLADWGRDVVLVDRAAAHRATPEETLVAGASAALEARGLRAPLEAAGAVFARRHGSLWGNDRLIVRKGIGELQVVRPSFDRVLREAARAAGATVLSGTVRDPLADGSITVVDPVLDRRAHSAPVVGVATVRRQRRRARTGDVRAARGARDARG
ncbi:MAG: hypothetical protein GY711_27415 [bacterium]|nr:hypothetical protein [bacterium]